MTCDLATLLKQACANNFDTVTETDKQLFRALVLQLLCNMSAGGIGGMAGTVDPEGVVTASPGQTYLNTTDESFWIKKTGTQTDTGWIELIA